MENENQADPEAKAEAEKEEELPPFKIEPARSARSKCKTCKRKIEKDMLRLGVLVEGAYGVGYMWNHLKCSAKRYIEQVQEAYKLESWEPGTKVPSLESLEALADKSATERAAKKVAPYVELAPSGRSKCKHSGKMIPKDSPRVVLLRSVEFYGQVRSAPVNVLPEFVQEELEREDSAIDSSVLAQELRENSRDTDSKVIEAVIKQIGLD